MANALYDKGREAFATGGINWTGDTIKVVLVDTGAYTVNLATHQFLSDIPAGARIATSSALGSKTATAGVCDAADVTHPAVAGASIEAAVIIKDTGSAATSPLIAYIDTATGLPVTPNGGDINVVWDNGANKIFKL
ncbi:TPA_asm: hypothetical protein PROPHIMCPROF_73 [Mycobacterium phage McProf]|uniref:hypothetical protein n=1 Tax=Mycobacteroides TaxID=670516 RepID=UPI000618A8A0|nr:MULTISPECIES: hypothetical protein [Mycobacteroides]VEG15743.1 Bacteriophage protein [Mycolicibacterium phlei]DAZ89960.1 TPA_asm: hypothetical protein PROPHIFSAT01-1_71 [Mycobacterium phage prophiFSAT01-1]DAZ90061.1 TPA_asm: hypothetical protein PROPHIMCPROF_73 [Mycobacterium phage McProf]AKC41226.1 hypothetical protein GR01_07520 [Mycobacteroides chelonae]ANA97690.1 hypothetical protein BB28_07985 [Mycobacteroides chelonae CCUG 47445]